jgi:hypothetical protein
MKQLFDDTGHASELLLTVLSDGQDAIVPIEARVHVDECPECLGRLGSYALEGAEVAHVFAVVAKERPSLFAIRWSPVPALVVGFSILMASVMWRLESGQSLGHAVHGLFSVGSTLRHNGPSLAESCMHIYRECGGLWVSMASALVLLLGGVAVARRQSRLLSSHKEVVS